MLEDANFIHEFCTISVLHLSLKLCFLFLVEKISIDRSCALLTRQLVNTERPKLNVIYEVVELNTPVPGSTDLNARSSGPLYSTSIQRGWNIEFRQNHSLYLNVNRLLEFRLVARNRTHDTGAVIGYCRIMVRDEILANGFRCKWFDLTSLFSILSNNEFIFLTFKWQCLWRLSYRQSK